MRIYLYIGILWMIRCFIFNIVARKDNYRKLSIYRKIQLMIKDIVLWPILLIIDVHNEVADIIEYKRKEENNDNGKY
jgi:hypothetical protein